MYNYKFLTTEIGTGPMQLPLVIPSDCTYTNEALSSCYHLSPTKMSIAASNTYCTGLGLYLVSVDSLDEFYYLKGIVEQCKLNICIIFKFLVYICHT